jgi:manganese/zinc/iron transport system substrate-binding protein
VKLVLVAWVFLLVACTQNNSPNEAQVSRESPKIKVTTTVNMVSDLVRQIGAGHVEVVEIMGPGVDPHLYKASANDVVKLQEADAIFYVGLLLEGKMEEVLGKLKDGGKPVYAVTENIDANRLLKPDEFEGHFDPHIWFEVLLWKETIDVVVSSLGKLDPANKFDYEANGKTAKAKMDELQQWAEAKVTEISLQKRILVTSHDAYNYFGRAYGFKVVALQGISTVSEAGLADRTKLVDFIKSQKVKAIFVETTVSPEAIKAIALEAGVTVGGELFSDAMGGRGQMEGELDLGTYEGMIRHNLTTIVNALR